MSLKSPRQGPGAVPGSRIGSPTYVCFAVKEEAKPFRDRVEAASDVEILLTGMGRRNAEQSLRTAWANAAPKLVVSCGFAGGLNPDLRQGTVLFSFESEPRLHSALLSAGAVPASFFCADRVAATAAEKKALRQTTGADAVEMESQVICAFCRERNVPSATVRVILDIAEEDLPLDFNQLMTAEQQLDSRKLALALARSPGKIPALLRLQRQSASAAGRLAEVLEKLLRSVKY